MISNLVGHNIVKILTQQLICTSNLLWSILLDVGELILPTHSLVLMHTESMIWQELHTLNHLISTQRLAQKTDILLGIAHPWHKHISKPERFTVLLQPCCRAQSLSIGSASQSLVLRAGSLLYIEQHQIYLLQKFLHSRIPYATVGIQTDMYAMEL